MWFSRYNCFSTFIRVFLQETKFLIMKYMNQERLYLENHRTLVLMACYIAWGVYSEKTHKSTVQSLMEQPTQFSATLFSAQGSYGDKYQAYSTRVLQLSNSTDILPRVATGSGIRKYIILADYWTFWTVTLSTIDAWAPFYSCRIWLTPPSFLWHNQVSAWLSLHVQGSDYCWCLSIDSFLYRRLYNKQYGLGALFLGIWEEGL